MSYITTDKLKLQGYRWEIRDPKALILIVHGLAEHSGRYGDLAKSLNKEGYSVIGFDSRGSGKSEGLVAHIDSFDQLTRDLDVVARQEQPTNIPFVLLGHSLGGLINTRYLIDFSDHPFDMAIFSAPAVKPDDKMAPLLRKAARLISALFPKLPAATLESKYISRDPNVRAKYLADSLIYKGKIRARKGYEIMKSMSYVRDRFVRIKLPILILHGTDDKIIDPHGSQLLYDGVSSENKTLKYYKSLYHEIFNEPERFEVIEDTVNWLNSVIATIK